MLMEKTLEKGDKPDTTPFERMFDSGKEKKIPYSRLAGNLLSDSFMKRKEGLGELAQHLDSALSRKMRYETADLKLDLQFSYGTQGDAPRLALTRKDKVLLSFEAYGDQFAIRGTEQLRPDTFSYKKETGWHGTYERDKLNLEKTLKKIFQDISSAEGSISFK